MMKKISALLVLLTLLLGGPPPPAQAQLMVTDLMGFGAGGDNPPVITFLQCSTAAATGSNPYTFSSINVGTASTDRKTVVAVMAIDATTVFTANSLTVGGDSATKSADNGAASAQSGVSLWILDNPSGTSENIVVTFSEAVGEKAVCVWSITGSLNSLTAVDFATGSVKGSSTQTLSSDLSDQGVAVGACVSDITTRTWTWVGMTERVDSQAGSLSIQRTAADYTATTAETNRTITAQPNGGGENGCAVATYR